MAVFEIAEILKTIIALVLVFGMLIGVLLVVLYLACRGSKGD